MPRNLLSSLLMLPNLPSWPLMPPKLQKLLPMLPRLQKPQPMPPNQLRTSSATDPLEVTVLSLPPVPDRRLFFVPTQGSQVIIGAGNR
jgi:hypothetical protein